MTVTRTGAPIRAHRHDCLLPFPGNDAMLVAARFQVMP